MADGRLRNLRIKTGIVKRLIADVVEYEKEAEKQKEKIYNLKLQDGNEYTVKKQEEVLHETYMMVPDSKKRLQAAYEDLEKLLENDIDIQDSEIYKEAQKIIEAAENIMEQKK